MNLEKVVFGFFVLLALTLNFGFFTGDIDNPDHHHVWELYAALVVSLIATVLKFGDRTPMGAVLLAREGRSPAVLRPTRHRRAHAWILVNPNVLECLETGEERPDGYFWRWLSRQRDARRTHSQST